MNSDYHIITTGGTIDVASIDTSGVYTFEQSIIPSIIEQGRINLPIGWTHLPPIDSLYMEDSYRENIFEVCKNAPEDRILITHGTDTLVETAQYLAARVSEKVIVLV